MFWTDRILQASLIVVCRLTIVGVLLSVANCAFAQGFGQPRNWVEESLNKTIVVEKNRTYTIQSSGTNVVIMPRESSPSGRVRPGEVKRYYGPSYRNDEAAQSGCYCVNRTSPRR